MAAKQSDGVEGLARLPPSAEPWVDVSAIADRRGKGEHVLERRLPSAVTQADTARLA